MVAETLTSFVSVSVTIPLTLAFGMGMMSAGGKPTPALEAALAKQRQAGRVDVVTAMTIGNGMRTFSLTTVSDPKAFLASTEAMMKAMREGDSPINVYKDVVVYTLFVLVLWTRPQGLMGKA